MLLFFLGIILIGYSTIISEETFTPEVIAENSFEVTAYLGVGDLFDIYISPGIDWAKPPFIDSSRDVWVNITDPIGNTTWIAFTYTPYGGQLLLYYISTISQESSYLTVMSLKPLRCKVQVGGNYTANIWFVSGTTEPPEAFQLRKLNINFKRPYSYLLPVGAVVVALGITILALPKSGLLKKSKRPPKKKEKIACFNVLNYFL